MIYHWIQREHNPNLLIVFNGWGMDHHPFRELRCDPDDDVLMFYDYRDLSIGEHVAEQCRHYDRLDVIAWSMGVWVYACLHDGFALRASRAVALNGTCRPIHEHHGISPQIYQATVAHFSRQSREKFFKRMCVSSDVFRHFQQSQPQRVLAGQKEELISIQQAAAQRQPAASCYTHALIGKKDKIIPAQHQQHFWEQHDAPYTCIDAPHFPFFSWKSWRAILHNATNHS